MFNTTFYNISFIPWQSVLLVEDTGVPGKNHRESNENAAFFYRPLLFIKLYTQ
jgi:hypothetical protein